MAGLVSSAESLLPQGASLSHDERTFLDAVERGTRAVMPAATLPGRWLEWLFTDRAAAAAIGSAGVHLAGTAAAPVRITGRIRAPNAVVSVPVTFEHCTFEGDIDLSLTRLAWLTFEGCRTAAISLRGATLQVLRFRYDSHCSGGIDLAVAHIERAADFTGASVAASSGPAFLADWLRIDGPLHFYSAAHSNMHFHVAGEMRLYGARVDREVSLRHAVLERPGQVVLNADQAVIGGTLACGDAVISGTVRLVGAAIKGDLVMDRVTLREGTVDDERKTKFALVADHASVGGSVYLRNCYQADGQTRLFGMSITRDLECQRAKFSYPDGAALNAENICIEGSLQFSLDDDKASDARQSAETCSSACLLEGDVVLRGATIKGALLWGCDQKNSHVGLSLESAHVRTLSDRQGAWPQPGRLELHNFVYDSIADDSPMDATSRVDWLRRSASRQAGGGFSHQSYNHLASVLRQQGRFADAREVLYAKERRFANEATLTLGDRWWYGIGVGPVRLGFGPLAGYGYRLKWSFVVFLVTVFGSAVVYMWGSPDLMAPRMDRPPTFQALAYSLDVFVPIVDLSQGDAWIPDPEKGRILARGPRGVLRTGGLLLLLYWGEIVLGWSVSTVLLGTVTARLVRE